MDELGPRVAAVLSDRYTIERELGRGGMATVFLAQDLKHHRPVAIKVLRPEIANAIGAERFLQEIEIAAQLTHPHILPLFDSGQADGLLFYVMPYVEGESLQDRLRREKQLPVEEALRITKHVAAALAHAHSLGIVHRDIKPGNIMLEGDEAVVADFGIARAISSAGGEHLTETGIALGTPAYMSPEQAGGEASIDGRSDLYSLGCVLYEMLGGEPPFTGPSSQAIIARHMQEQPRSLRIVRPKIPPAIEAVVQTALEKVPADRFSTASHLIEALEHPELVKIHPPTTSKRRYWLAALVGAVAIVLLAFGIRGFGGTDASAADPNRIMVFPLVERGQIETGTGVDAAIMIGNALEHTEPLKWLDGWNWLPESQRENATLVSTEAHRFLSLNQRAGFHISGFIVGTGDSATVTLQLHDVAGDTLVVRESAAGLSDRASILTLGVRATVRLLPKLIEPERGIDLEALGELTSADPAAIAHWIQGEKEYRRAHFSAALDHYSRALGEDSSLAFAALKGAEAANWEERIEDAEHLIDLALANERVLPGKYLSYAHGLKYYFSGMADSAVARFREVLRLDRAWPEAWAALGEVYYHLLPQEPHLDSLAEAAFRTSREVDPHFAPPLLHLTQSALRQEDLTQADQLLRELEEVDLDSSLTRSLHIMRQCVTEGTAGERMVEIAEGHPGSLLEAMRNLTPGGANLGCAEAGFRALLEAEAPNQNERWSALLGLNHVLTVRDRTSEAERLLDSAVAGGMPAANFLYIYNVLAGAGILERADVVMEDFAGPYDSLSSLRLWFNGLWQAYLGHLAAVDTIALWAERKASQTSEPADQLFALGLRARSVLLQGDTAQAVGLLRRIVPRATRQYIGWGLWEPFSGERLLLAELLLRQGRLQEAIRVAESFDGGQTIMDLLYLPASLRLRAEAYEENHETAIANAHRERLRTLSD